MVAWHPRGELLASCSYDDTIKLWVNDGDEWVCAQTLGGSGIGHTSTVWGIAFDSQGKRLASCGDDLTVRVWHCGFNGSQPNFKLESTITGYHERTVYSVDWSQSGLLATADGSNCIKVFQQSMHYDGAMDPNAPPASWHLASHVRQAHDLDVNCVRWHPSRQHLLASAGDDGTVKIWRVENT